MRFAPEVFRGQACFRMPPSLYRMLHALKPPGATPWELHDCKGWLDPDALRWGIIKIVKMRIPHGEQIVDGVVLTDWGRRLSYLVRMEKLGRNTRPPLTPIRDLLAECKPEIVEVLAGTPPIPKTEGASLFEALGVLILDPVGESHYLRTGALRDGIREFRTGHDGPELVDDFLTPEQMAFLRRAFTGLRVEEADLDGRSIKPLLPGYMGLVDRYDNFYRPVPAMKAFVALAMAATRNPVELFDALPELDKVWLVSSLTSEQENVHTYLLHKMGWIYKKGRHWALTSLAKDQVGGWTDHLRGAPVELMLPPDLPSEPDDFSVLDGVTEPDGPDIYAVDFGALDLMVQTTERVIGKHPALAAPYSPAPPPRIDNLYATPSAKGVDSDDTLAPEDDDFDIL